MKGYMLEVLDDFIRLPFALGAADRLEGSGSPPAAIPQNALVSRQSATGHVGYHQIGTLISSDGRRQLSAFSIFVREITEILQ